MKALGSITLKTTKAKKICRKMNAHQDFNMKQNKSDTKGQTLCGFSYMRNRV